MNAIYVETTVIGNVAGRLHPKPSIADRQQLTRDWWAGAPSRYRVFVSQLTIDECSDGDSDASAERLEVLRGIPLLDQTDRVESLAGLLIERVAVPKTEPRDALHIATAAVHGVQFIVTWNFKHILNPHLQGKIADTCREAGYVPPVICTPEQLRLTDDES